MSMESLGETAAGRFAYVGSYSRPNAGGQGTGGISVYAVAPDGALSLVQTVRSENPTFLALHPTQRYLYAVNEIDDFQGQQTGSVEAYAIDAESGTLTLINREAANGSATTHLVVNPDATHIVVANYNGSSFAVLPIRDDGGLGPVTDTIAQTGSGPDTSRQEGPHPHGVALSPDGRIVATADLGIDKVQSYLLDTAGGRLQAAGEAVTTPGAGPRHLAFHPTVRVLYAINELDATAQVFPYDPETGQLGEAVQTIPTLTEPSLTETWPAEIAVYPSGRVAYSSNRRKPTATSPEADSIVVYAVDGESGTLTRTGFGTEGIRNPRHFALDPSGTRLYACNQDGNTIVQFAVDLATGALTPTGQPVETAKPVCIVFTTAS